MSRIINFLGGEDRAVAALFGARWFQTISGSAGRACGYGGGVRRWWGPPAAAVIDRIPGLRPPGPGHCEFWALAEQRMGEELGADGA